MIDFEAGSFSDLAGTTDGTKLWEYLNSPEALACLETTTYLGRPALEGLQPRMMEKFGAFITVDRWKQLAGRMVRQVMEHRGYALDQTGVRCRVGDLFTSAARYRKYNHPKTQE